MKRRRGDPQSPLPRPSSAESIKYNNKQKTRFPLFWPSWVSDKGSSHRRWCFWQSLCQVTLAGGGGRTAVGQCSALETALLPGHLAALGTWALARPSPAFKQWWWLPCSNSTLNRNWLFRPEREGGAVLAPIANQAEIIQAPQLVSHET